MNDNCNKSNDPLLRLKQYYAFCKNQRSEGPDYELKSTLHHVRGNILPTSSRLVRPVVQSAASLTAESGNASSIPARSHTFVEMDHEIIPTFHCIKKGCCQLQAKVCVRSILKMVNRLVKLTQEVN